MENLVKTCIFNQSHYRVLIRTVERCWYMVSMFPLNHHKFRRLFKKTDPKWNRKDGKRTGGHLQQWFKDFSFWIIDFTTVKMMYKFVYGMSAVLTSCFTYDWVTQWQVPNWLTYDFPPAVKAKVNRLWGGEWHGQAQKWYVFLPSHKYN